MKLFQLLPEKIVHLTCNWPRDLLSIQFYRTHVRVYVLAHARARDRAITRVYTRSHSLALCAHA